MTVGILQDTVPRSLTTSRVEIIYDITGIHLGRGVRREETERGYGRLLELHSARAETALALEGRRSFWTDQIAIYSALDFSDIVSSVGSLLSRSLRIGVVPAGFIHSRFR